MKNIWILVIVLVVVGFTFWPSFKGLVVKDDGLVACTMEAKLCPDGSAVGRSGPKCEFAPCPTVATSTEPIPVPIHVPAPMPAAAVGNITLAIGQTGKVGNVAIKLNSFVQDSRCPIDVQCIQAGAVVVNVTMTSGAKSATRNFPSDEVPYVFAGQPISIVDIAPPRQSHQETPAKDLRITFHVGK